MNLKQRLLTCSVAATLAASSVAQGTGFGDGFEATTLDPFWTPQTTSGSIAFPSMARVHSGRQAVQFNSIETTANKFVALTHTFAQPVYGRLSVWAFDEGAGVSSSNGIFLYLENPTGTTAHVGATDYDDGINQGGTYNFGPPGAPGVFTSIRRTQAWHHWVVDTTATALEISIDGTQVYSGPGGFAVRKVTLGMQAPSWRPAFRTSFDDFLFTPPTPATYSLFGAGCAGPNGTPSLQMPVAGPRLGSTFTVEVSSLPLVSAAFGILGASNSRLGGGTPLPLSLTPIGMPGCDLLVSDDYIEFLGTRSNPTTAVWTLPVPIIPELLGATLFQQALVIQPGANATGVIMSNGGRGTIGDR